MGPRPSATSASEKRATIELRSRCIWVGTPTSAQNIDAELLLDPTCEHPLASVGQSSATFERKCPEHRDMRACLVKVTRYSSDVGRSSPDAGRYLATRSGRFRPTSGRLRESTPLDARRKRFEATWLAHSHSSRDASSPALAFATKLSSEDAPRSSVLGGNELG